MELRSVPDEQCLAVSSRNDDRDGVVLGQAVAAVDVAAVEADY